MNTTSYSNSKSTPAFKCPHFVVVHILSLIDNDAQFSILPYIRYKMSSHPFQIGIKLMASGGQACVQLVRLLDDWTLVVLIVQILQICKPELFSQMIVINLPVSQLVPSYPAGQKHAYLAIPSKHVAPFWHGLLAHSRISVRSKWERNCHFLICITAQFSVICSLSQTLKCQTF